MAKHTLELLETLLSLGRGQGGNLVAVFGDPLARGRYWAGARYPPLPTLFEAVMRCLLPGGYTRVVAFTGHDQRYLPQWRVGANFRLGDEPTIWIVKGEEVGRRPDLRRVSATMPWEEANDGLDVHTTSSIERLLWHGANLTYWDRLEAYTQQVEEELRRTVGGGRCALVVEYSFLTPSVQEAAALRETGVDPRRLNQIRAKFGRDFTGTGLDLFLVTEEGMAHELLREDANGEPPFVSKVLETYMSPSEWELYKPTLERKMPHLWLGPNARQVEAMRSPAPVAGTLLDWQASDKAQPLYQHLRGARLNRNPSSATPPKRPEEVALEFWANIDVEPLRTALDDEIIGQERAKEVILSLLRRQKEKCAQLLERNHQARKTVRDENFRLPIVGLFGAAGMGKSTFCETLVHLFGDPKFWRRIDLGGKSLKVATIGIEPPMVGCDQPSDLISFANETRGLGVVCFDEFTRIQLPQQSSFSDALGPLLEILQSRKLEPANPRFRPPSRFYHFANTLFVFSGNVSPSGERAPEGFHSIDSLGTAFGSRVSEQVFFTALAEEDYRRAVRRALGRGALEWAKDFDPEGHEKAAGRMEVDERLAEIVENRFRSTLKAAGEAPSLRRLNGLLSSGLNYDRAFDAARQAGWGRLTLGPEILPEGWAGL